MRRSECSVPIPSAVQGLLRRSPAATVALAEARQPARRNHAPPERHRLSTLDGGMRDAGKWNADAASPEVAEALYSFPPFSMANPSPKATHPATQDATTPAAVVRCGTFSGAVFKRLVKAKDGEEFATFQVSLRRSYQDAEGKWQHTQTLREEDLLPAALTLTRCFERIMAARGEPRE